MAWIKAFHIIVMVTWFCGLFYLPRLFVYHAMSQDTLSKDRFKIMERKLYFGITTPGAILTIISGVWLLSFNFPYYIHQLWLQLKIFLVLLLICYHLYLGKLWWVFYKNKNQHSHQFYRWINEIPTVFLIFIVILVVVKPGGTL